MLRRSSALRFSVTLGSWLGLFLSAGSAHAHRLIIECHVLPGGNVQVESWFDLTGKSPRAAKVEVLRAGDQPLTEGRLNDDGVFLFSFERAEPLRVIVSAGDGHRAEQVISAEDLARSATGAATTTPTNQTHSSIGPSPRSDRSARVSAADVLAGVAFLLALAAFLMSWRNTRRLRCLQSKTGEQQPSGGIGCGHGVE